VGGDFTKEEEMMKLCKDITAIYPEGIDILINNAGIPFVDVDFVVVVVVVDDDDDDCYIYYVGKRYFVILKMYKR
jgi:NAD(P)-dependent dehydrogenase (short-subunit alcohol dehydrogenase family)